MLRIRLVCVAAATLSIASAAAGGGANAQSASTDLSNTPSLLTQLFSQATAAAPASPAPAASTAAAPVQSTRSRRVASRKHRAYTKQATNQHGDPSADTVQSKASADAWLTASAPQTNATPVNSAPASQPATADAPQMAAADPAQQDNAPPSASTALPSSVVVGGQTVQIAEADQVNEIDLAASSAPANAPAGNVPANDAFAAAAPSNANTGPTVQATMETTLPRGDRADMIGVAAVKAAQADTTQAAYAAAVPDGGEAVADSAAQDSDTQDFSAEASSTARSLAWIAEVLAALGGAVTAGIVAWFLIGAEPVRNYG